MSIKSPHLIIFILFLSGLSIDLTLAQSPCNPIRLEVNVGSQEVFPSQTSFRTDTNFVSYTRFSVGALKLEFLLNIDFAYLIQGMEVRIYNRSDVDCFSDHVPVTTYKIVAASESINLNGRLNSGDYAISIHHPHRSIPNYKIQVVNYQLHNACDEQYNKVNSISLPLPLRPLVTNRIDESSCTKGCHKHTARIFNKRLPMTNRIKWYSLETKDLAFIDVSIQSTSFDIHPLLLIVRKESDNYFLLNEYNSQGASLEISYFPIYLSDEILIGVTTSNEEFFSYDLQIEIYDHKLDCIDFLEGQSGDTLLVTSTSQGSPLTGPFVEGEEVTFCYQIDNWFPVENNWLQGVIPTFGDDWDPMSFDSLFQSMPIHHSIPAPDTDGGMWKWIETDQSGDPNGPSSGVFKGSGWYFESTFNKTRDDFKYSWGAENSIFIDADEPLYEFCFTLKTKDMEDCNDNPDLTIGVSVYSDVITGRYYTNACTKEAEEMDNWLMCCDTIPPPELADSILCEGETTRISIDAPAGYQIWWYQDEIKEENLLATTAGFDFVSPQIDQSELKIYLYIVWASSNDMCRDTIKIPLNVVDKPDFDIDNHLSFCVGELIRIAPRFQTNLQGLADYDVTWDLIDQRGEFTGLEQVGIELAGYLEASGMYSIQVKSPNGCAASDIVQLNMNEGYLPDMTTENFLCGSDFFEFNLAGVDGVSFQYRNQLQDNWLDYPWRQVQLSSGNYQIKSETAQGCITLTDFQVEEGSNRDSMLIVYCQAKNDFDDDIGRFDDVIINYYFKPADCPDQDTFFYYLPDLACELETGKHEGFQLIKSEETRGKLRAYPNPVSDSERLIVEFDQNSIAELCIIDFYGNLFRCFHTEDKNMLHIDVHDLPAGQYLLIGRKANRTASIHSFTKF